MTEFWHKLAIFRCIFNQLNCRMKNFNTKIQLRWSDLDPNAHVRHSVYYDWGALIRITYLHEKGLTTELMQRLQIGPILFREECIFKREMRIGDEVSVGLVMVRARRDFSRWTIRHTIYKNPETIGAILTVDGAWIDIAKRKLAITPQEVKDVFVEMPTAEDFAWEEVKI
jgi:acyl-CoA thioester hydrolase